MKTWQKIGKNMVLLDQYLVREKVIDTIRTFFKSQKFHEVFTPILVPVPSCEPNLEVFKTELRTSKGLKRDGFLIMSPEYAIKKLLSAGIGNCFEITRCFRNEEEVSRLHSPEFTMLEWYRINADYTSVMTDCEELFTKILGESLNYQGQKYDLSRPWPRITVAQAFEKYAGITAEQICDESFSEKFYQIFFNQIEPAFKESQRPVIVYDYPLYQASLSRKSHRDPRFAERFEIFLAGVELGNCFSELIDAKEQAKRFREELAIRKKSGKTNYPMDADLIEALKIGLPPVSGIAVGVDRLIMLAADVPTVSDTLFFPANEEFNL